MRIGGRRDNELRKLYEKSELGFALVWIGLYVTVMNIALQLCGGFDDLGSKTVFQVLIPVVCICVLAVAATAWILGNNMGEKFGFCRFRGDIKNFLWFIPLILMSCINLKNGLGLSASWTVSALMAMNMALAGYVEEIIFRGFLFRAMEKENLKSALIVSAVTFGAGHIVNLANTVDTIGVLLQVCYAIVIGFLYTVIVYKGGSLWPCIASHMAVNATSVFALEQGVFTDLIAAVFGRATENIVSACGAAVIMVISGAYAIYLWKKGDELLQNK
jgi:membrane protease YdiL (CAAX protease family)